VPETEWQDDHGFVRVQVADPDGYRVELFGCSGRLGGDDGSSVAAKRLQIGLLRVAASVVEVAQTAREAEIGR